MKNELAIKVYDVDYSFIIKNYLDKELWHKSWTVFQWRNIVAKINLHRIDVYDDSVFINVQVKDSDSGFSCSMLTYYYVEKCDISFLKKKINSVIMDCLESIEKQIIKDREEYSIFKDIEYKESENIKTIVEEYFKSKDIKSKVVIESTESNCIEEISMHGDYSSEYEDGMRYKILPELFNEFARISDKKLYVSDYSPSDVLNEAKKYYEFLDSDLFESVVIKYIEGEEFSDKYDLREIIRKGDYNV